ncbi:MAG: TIM barrel protein [Oscillospiraceae bacterium]|nr:TIM barrel protein [Oscillospiraceae bacterium]
MIQSINFPISTYSIAPYGSWEELGKRIHGLGLDGIEGIADPGSLDGSFPTSMLSGYHMVFYPDWLDFYRQNMPELLRKFGSMETVERFYLGRSPEDLMKQFRDDLNYALSMNTPYVVFHVSDVSIEEGYTYRWLHTDREVLDGAIEFINELLHGIEPTFDFLVENQWWPGFTFTDPHKTEYMLSGIGYPRTGIMLDTGHLLNTQTKLHTQAEGIEYILDKVRMHGELKKKILGMHFHQSISGAYVRKNTGRLPDDLPADYFEAFSVNYSHIQKIDRHLPWTDPGCVRIIDEVCPLYLTHELSSGPHRSQLAAAKRQIGTIRKGYGE